MYKTVIKRGLDILLSLIALPFIVLLLVVMAPVIWLEDKGPVFYNAPRRGRNGKVFKMYKFRSMYVNVPDLRNADGSTYNGDADPRVTKVGRFMRKTSIDELPQLLNVLKGDMSFVGPRPSLTTLPYEQYNGLQKKRVTVRPGITGYSQAYFRNAISQEQKFQNDCYYVDHVSFLFDVKILWHTFLAVVKRENIYVEQGSPVREVVQEEKVMK